MVDANIDVESKSSFESTAQTLRKSLRGCIIPLGIFPYPFILIVL